MSHSDLIVKYFQGLTGIQYSRFEKLHQLYNSWNEKINLVSRADIVHLYERHVLHSLAVAKFVKFQPDTSVLDIGTGGGFPGIPLAIMFPEVKFTLVDSIGKKITVVKDVIEQLQLENCTAICTRAEQVDDRFDFTVSRATAPLKDLVKWSRPLIKSKQLNAIPNGIICLKGGDLKEEIRPFEGRTEVVNLSDYFEGEYFITKRLVFVTI